MATNRFAATPGERDHHIHEREGEAMAQDLTRRAWMAGVAGGVAMASTEVRAQAADKPSESFGFCLNTSTIRDAEGKSRPVTELVEIAAKAGYQAIEPWISELDAHAKAGASLKDLGKRIADLGLVVPDAIGFAEWIVEDPDRRKKGLEQARRDMDLVRQIGGKHIAAPPVGA